MTLILNIIVQQKYGSVDQSNFIEKYIYKWIKKPTLKRKCGIFRHQVEFILTSNLFVLLSNTVFKFFPFKGTYFVNKLR